MLQLIPDQLWLQLFLSGDVKFTCRESPGVLKSLLSGQKCNLCLPHSAKTFCGYTNSHLPNGHTQGMVSNTTNIPSFKRSLWEVVEAQYLSIYLIFYFLFYIDANENALVVISNYPHRFLQPIKLLMWMLPNLLWSLEFIVIKSK